MRAILTAVVCALLAGCSSPSPTSPGPGAAAGLPTYSSTTLVLLCQTAGQDAVCRAFESRTSVSGSSQREVTATVQWIADPANAVEMIAPGRFRPTRSGAVAIDARIDEEVRTLVPTRFLLAPGTDARPLAILWVSVRGPEGPVGQADVAVLDGYAAGTTCRTEFGICIIDAVLPVETFSLRVTSSGYQPATATFAGRPPGMVPTVTMTVSLTRQQ